MSAKHPIIAITGSSGAGTTTVQAAFEQIFRREGLNPAVIEGDSFHRYDRAEMKALMAEDEKSGGHLSHFGPEANLFGEIETLFRTYADTGTGNRRYYLHNAEEAEPCGQDPGTFTPWAPLDEDSDLLFYEGLHGAVVTGDVDIAQYPDLIIGVVPVINLEWIQKINRDCRYRGYSIEAVTDVILRRMPRLRALHHPPVQPHARELPAGPHRRHLQPVRGPHDTVAGRVDAGDQIQGFKGHRFPVSSEHAARLVHVAPEHDRRAGRQDGPRHAAHLHAVHHAHGRAAPQGARAVAPVPAPRQERRGHA